MSNSFNSARFFFLLSISVMFLSACNLSNILPAKNQTLKQSTLAHLLLLSNKNKNAYLFDYQKNNFEKSSTKKLKDSTDLIELALADQSKPIMTFVQYSY